MKNYNKIRRIAINTGGGDAPGLNAVIRAATLTAQQNGWEVVGIRRGYMGLLVPEIDGEPGLVPLTADTISGITHLGGTILGTTTRGNPFGLEVREPDGTWGNTDRSLEIIDRFREAEIDALIAELSSPDAAARQEATRKLVEMGPDAQAALEAFEAASLERPTELGRDNAHWFGGTSFGSPLIAVFERPDAPAGKPGIGGSHHFALAVADRNVLLRWKRRFIDNGYNVNGILDRHYFQSIYIKDPDGQIVELATLGPGWAVDEPPDLIGTSHRAPPTRKALPASPCHRPRPTRPAVP